MTEEERLAKALEEVEAMRKEVAALRMLDLDAALQTGGPRIRGSSARKVQHGEPTILVENFIAKDAGFFPLTAPAGLRVDAAYTRTVTPMRSAHQRKMIIRVWKYRNFKQCGVCGCFDTWKSRNSAETNGIEFWCYQCGAQEEEVLKEYEPLPDAKFKQRECADCGKKLFVTRGDLLFPTGEIDPATRKPDYRCLECKEKLEAINAKKGGKNATV